MKRIHSKGKGLLVYYSSDISAIETIIVILNSIFYNSIDVSIGEVLDVSTDAFYPYRNQYNAEILLQRLSSKIDHMGIWLISPDIFVDDMNFIFGLARFFDCGIVSTFRLPSQQMIVKELTHEIGHILGLPHCENNCVMEFSNNLYDAKKKPMEFCKKCRIMLS